MYYISNHTKDNIYKNTIAIILIITMIIAIIRSQIIVEASNNSKVEVFKNEISMIDDFSIWDDAKVVFDSVIYTIDGDEKYKLYSVVNDFGKIGYMITDLDTSVVIEFALGESPYDYILNFKNSKSKSENIKLISENVNYLFTINNFNTIENIHKSDMKNKDSLDAVQKTKNKKDSYDQGNNIVDTLPHDITHIISGVPYELNNGTTPGCGPVSGINILKYWDSHGYPNLVSTSDTKQSLYDRLYSDMSSFHWDGQVATPPWSYSTGLVGYFYTKGYNLGISTDADVLLSDFATIKSQVDNNMPSTILYDNSNGYGEQYGAHYVTLAGYSITTNEAEYYIIHDLWNTVDVYRSWFYDVSSTSIIWQIYLIQPY